MADITINGRPFAVEEDRRLLTILNENGFRIPHLCFHHALKPAASCKLCVVEIKERGKPPKTRLSCAVKPKEGMEIVTESAMIHQLRNEAITKLLRMAPHADVIHQIGAEFGLTTGMKPDGCIRCRLCVRVCSEIIGANALTMEKRDGVLYVVPSDTGECLGCATCANICPTKAIRAEDEGNVRTIRIRDEVVGRHPLERCEICGQYFATPRFLDHVKARESDHPHEKEPHRHCPMCAKIFARRKLRINPPRLSRTYAGKPDA